MHEDGEANQLIEYDISSNVEKVIRTVREENRPHNLGFPMQSANWNYYLQFYTNIMITIYRAKLLASNS